MKIGFPIHSFGLVAEKDLELLVKRFNRLYPDITYEPRYFRDFPSVIPPFKIDRRGRSRHFLLAALPTTRWSIVLWDSTFDNAWSTHLHNLNRLFKYEGLCLHHQADPPGTVFSYFTADLTRRTVYSIKEDRKWVFYQDGPMMPFEAAAPYGRRAIAERFNLDVALSFVSKLGVVDPESAICASSRFCVLTEHV